MDQSVAIELWALGTGLGQLVLLEVAPDDLRGGHVAHTGFGQSFCRKTKNLVVGGPCGSNTGRGSGGLTVLCHLCATTAAAIAVTPPRDSTVRKSSSVNDHALWLMPNCVYNAQHCGCRDSSRQ
jgi:hypothetical protein